MVGLPYVDVTNDNRANHAFTKMFELRIKSLDVAVGHPRRAAPEAKKYSADVCVDNVPGSLGN